MSSSFESENWWSDAWVRHLENYLAAPPRAGVWLAARFNLANKRILEIAGGSCRDARYLANKGLDAVGSDFDQKTLDYLAKRFPDSPLRLMREDAAQMSFQDNAFDMTFHNGFWVLFKDNEKLLEFFKEQVRVSRETLVIFVHNQHNAELVSEFAERAKQDPLYDIRFFQRDELRDICAMARIPFKRIGIEKFGGPVDQLYNLLRRLPWLPAALFRLVPWLYRLQPWSTVERIAVVIEL